MEKDMKSRPPYLRVKERVHIVATSDEELIRHLSTSTGEGIESIVGHNGIVVRASGIIPLETKEVYLHNSDLKFLNPDEIERLNQRLSSITLVQPGGKPALRVYTFISDAKQVGSNNHHSFYNIGEIVRISSESCGIKFHKKHLNERYVSVSL